MSFFGTRETIFVIGAAIGVAVVGTAKAQPDKLDRAPLVLAQDQQQDDSEEERWKKRRERKERSEQQQEKRERRERSERRRDQKNHRAEQEERDRRNAEREQRKRRRNQAEQGDRDRRNTIRAERERRNAERKERERRKRRAEREERDRRKEQAEQEERDRRNKFRAERERRKAEEEERERRKRRAERKERDRHKEQAEQEERDRRNKFRAERERRKAEEEDRERKKRRAERDRRDRREDARSIRERLRADKEAWERKRRERGDKRQVDRDRRERIKEFLERRDVSREEREERRRERREFSRERLRDIVRKRREHREGDRDIIEEGNRRIIREKGHAIVEHDDTERLRGAARDFRVEEGRGGRKRTVITRRNGVQIISIRGRDGRLIRRVKKFPNGVEIVLINNEYDERRRHRHRGRRGPAFYIDLPDLGVDFRRRDYYVYADDADEDEIYDVLTAPPIEDLEEDYTLDEIRYSPDLRKRLRKLNLNTVSFEFGSWDVPDDQIDALSVVARVINRIVNDDPEQIVLIAGHTDAVGSDEDNLSLSDRRAETVARLLTDEFDVPPENLVTQGYGESDLLIDTDGPEERNRRVEFMLITPYLAQN